MLTNHIGDELYEAEFYEELPEGTLIEAEIQSIVVQLLREFSFLEENEEYKYGDEEDNLIFKILSSGDKIKKADMEQIEELSGSQLGQMSEEAFPGNKFTVEEATREFITSIRFFASALSTLKFSASDVNLTFGIRDNSRIMAGSNFASWIADRPITWIWLKVLGAITSAKSLSTPC